MEFRLSAVHLHLKKKKLAKADKAVDLKYVRQVNRMAVRLLHVAVF